MQRPISYDSMVTINREFTNAMQETVRVGSKPGKRSSSLQKFLDSAQVAIGMLAFCSVSIFGLAAIAWATAVALDPVHSVMVAFRLVAPYCRTPLGVAAGLAVFYAAVSWESAQMREQASRAAFERRLAMIAHRRGVEKRRGIDRRRQAC